MKRADMRRAEMKRADMKPGDGGPSYDFAGRSALITGGTSGIGRATALAFARAGADVAIAGRNQAAGRQICEEIEASGGKPIFVATDVRDDSQVAAAVAGTVAAFGRLDFAANCAGIGGDMAPLPRTDQQTWDDVMATNARGVWLAMRHEIAAMIATGGGAIVNMSSIYGIAGRAAHHAYVASKHAVIGMTRSVALEVAAHGIRVNAVCAGVTRTASMAQAEALYPQVVEAMVAEHPIGRMASEQEIADAILWLCSRGAGYVTGAPLLVDGGFLAA
jgi:NAD(P)-dependent dehydrogenase (short-subunit alcohol dehydrogenase family)